MLRYGDLIRVAAWTEIFRPDLKPRSVKYHCRLQHLKMEDGEPGAEKSREGWMVHPLAKIIQEPHPAGPGRPKGSADKKKRKSRKLSYNGHNSRIDSLISKSKKK